MELTDFYSAEFGNAAKDILHYHLREEDPEGISDVVVIGAPFLIDRQFYVTYLAKVYRLSGAACGVPIIPEIGGYRIPRGPVLQFIGNGPSLDALQRSVAQLKDGVREDTANTGEQVSFDVLTLQERVECAFDHRSDAFVVFDGVRSNQFHIFGRAMPRNAQDLLTSLAYHLITQRDPIDTDVFHIPLADETRHMLATSTLHAMTDQELRTHVTSVVPQIAGARIGYQSRVFIVWPFLVKDFVPGSQPFLTESALVPRVLPYTDVGALEEDGTLSFFGLE